MNGIIDCRAKCWTTVLIAIVLIGAITPRMGTAADKAAIKQAVSRAAGYLRTNMADFRNYERVLAAYALYKAGDPATSPEVSSILEEIVNKFSDGKYSPSKSNANMYEAGVTAMFLADVDPEQYRPQIQILADYLLKNQMENGAWDYRHGAGDTSLTQYGCLGLWAAVRAGIDIPDEAWDKVLLWHYQNQLNDGGYPYVPGARTGPGKGSSTLNMSGAAVGSMAIAAMHLFPESSEKSLGFAGPKKSKKAVEDPNRKFGILERQQPKPEEDSDAEATPLPVKPKPQGPYQKKTTFASFKRSVSGALGWVHGHFEVENSVGPKMYYYYTIERMAALINIEEIGGQDWFEVCSQVLLKKQENDGSWTLDVHDRSPYPVGTSFGILFLTRSTAKLLNRVPPASAIGAGLLAGGRGLPDDLSQVELDRGAVAAREPAGPLDELLRDLSKAGGEDLFKVQEKIIEKIQLGDRSELIGQTDQLVKLIDHPDPQIRRIAMWALGRSDDLKLVRHAIAALIDDPDIGVLVEAHNALCWFSRRPDGFGLPNNPVSTLAPDASDDDRRITINKWRRQALKAWGEWYLRICPYEERDDPFVVSLKRRLNARR